MTVLTRKPTARQMRQVYDIVNEAALSEGDRRRILLNFAMLAVSHQQIEVRPKPKGRRRKAPDMAVLRRIHHGLIADGQHYEVVRNVLGLPTKTGTGQSYPHEVKETWELYLRWRAFERSRQPAHDGEK